MLEIGDYYTFHIPSEDAMANHSYVLSIKPCGYRMIHNVVPSNGPLKLDGTQHATKEEFGIQCDKIKAFATSICQCGNMGI